MPLLRLSIAPHLREFIGEQMALEQHTDFSDYLSTLVMRAQRPSADRCSHDEAPLRAIDPPDPSAECAQAAETLRRFDARLARARADLRTAPEVLTLCLREDVIALASEAAERRSITIDDYLMQLLEQEQDDQSLHRTLLESIASGPAVAVDVDAFIRQLQRDLLEKEAQEQGEAPT